MTLLHSISHPSRLHDIRFCKRVVGTGELLLVAAEDKKLSIYDTSSNPDELPTIVAEMIGHSNRFVYFLSSSTSVFLKSYRISVKAVDTLSIALPSSPSYPSSTTIVCTISSDGKIHIYNLAFVPTPKSSMMPSEKVQIEPVAIYDTTGTRLTCVTLAEGDALSNGELRVKRKRDDDDDGDGDGNIDNNDEVEQLSEGAEGEFEDEDSEEED